jgi:uncharacterized protein involved in type VI secretion and phage assembly
MSAPAFPIELLQGCQLGIVVSVEDPRQLARVKIKLPVLAGEDGAEMWARVAVPFAGPNRGALFIPDVNDEVLVAFVGGDPRYPIVIGGLWNGADAPPDQFAGNRVDRWLIKGTHGTQISIVEESASTAKVHFETPNGVKGTLTDESGGSIKFEDTAGNSITIDSQGISLEATAKVKIQASQVEVTAGMVKVDSAMADFSGIVKCTVLQATTVAGTSYTPGAGNVW